MTIIMVRGDWNLKISDLEFYSLAEAKKNFAKVVKKSETNDVVITRNGKPSVVMVNYSKYVKLMDFISNVYELYLIDVGEKEFPLIKDIKKIIFESSEEVSEDGTGTS
ncbi:MAG: hypothetical protein PWQ20_290 [Thermotogaceae bacterium]|jgi:prevent-host-death family protein|nr:hypothetical protein [Thermotogaceae bacterium]MDN5337220.1 hypothetical protein [Thermotogaceae bacterium]